MRKALLLIGMGCAALVGCRAEVRTQADFSVSGRGEVEEPASAPESAEAFAEPPAEEPPIMAKQAPPPDRAPFIGVTPDLTLAPASSREATCNCLALAHGQPGSSAFQWQGGPPAPTDDSMAVAISGDGVECTWSEGEVPVPSIAGVERSDNDVVLTIEAAREGRPIMRGAMILRPGPNGALIVKGKGKVPFGQRADGAPGACRIDVP